MSRYDHWKTTPPEPQMLAWQPEMLWDSETVTFRLVHVCGGYRSPEITGHRCLSCNRFLTTTPCDDEAEVVDGIASFEFRCSSCSSVHDVRVAVEQQEEA